MTDEANAMDFVGRVAMKWLQDYAENPKHGSYMEAIADLTALILAGAVETATRAGNGKVGVGDRAEELDDGREVPELGLLLHRLPTHLSQPSAEHGKGDSSTTG
jgi:hypothetical protein